MKKGVIDHYVVQAESLDQFRYSSGGRKGQRIHNMPYWIKSRENWLFDWIRADTDVQLLSQEIAKGQVYIMDKIAFQEN